MTKKKDNGERRSIRTTYRKNITYPLKKKIIIQLKEALIIMFILMMVIALVFLIMIISLKGEIGKKEDEKYSACVELLKFQAEYLSFITEKYNISTKDSMNEFLMVKAKEIIEERE